MRDGCAGRRGHIIVPSSSFMPIATPSARVLILGSLPGRVSLARGEYYALAQNAFWRIMGHLFGAGPELHYADRVERLRRCRVGGKALVVLFLEVDAERGVAGDHSAISHGDARIVIAASA